MNPNPDETSPASGRQQSKSLEEAAMKLVDRIFGCPFPFRQESAYAIILRALQAATAESDDTAIVDWFEKRGSTRSFWKQSCPQHDGSIKTGWINNFTHNRAMDSMQPTFREAVAAARQQERSQK